MRCYYASPFASHVIGPEAAVWAAVRALTRLPGWLKPVLHVSEVREREHCCWSPLIQGEFLLRQYGPVVFSEAAALAWCLRCLEHQGFDTLILSSIPRAKGYGWNGVDTEKRLAKKLGYRIISEPEVFFE